MITFVIIVVIIAELLLWGLYAYMKPRGGLRALIIREK